jgi:hypothetical protein
VLAATGLLLLALSAADAAFKKRWHFKDGAFSTAQRACRSYILVPGFAGRGGRRSDAAGVNSIHDGQRSDDPWLDK